MAILRPGTNAVLEKLRPTAIRLVYETQHDLYRPCAARKQFLEPGDHAGFTDAFLRIPAQPGRRHADRARQLLLGGQTALFRRRRGRGLRHAALLRRQAAGQALAALRALRLHRLAVQLCEPQGRRRLAGAVRHQRALSPPVVVHDGRRGQTGLPGQHLLPIPLVERI